GTGVATFGSGAAVVLPGPAPGFPAGVVIAAPAMIRDQAGHRDRAVGAVRFAPRAGHAEVVFRVVRLSAGPAGVPIGVAVVPTAVGRPGTRRLIVRIARGERAAAVRGPGVIAGAVNRVPARGVSVCVVAFVERFQPLAVVAEDLHRAHCGRAAVSRPAVRVRQRAPRVADGRRGAGIAVAAERAVGPGLVEHARFVGTHQESELGIAARAAGLGLAGRMVGRQPRAGEIERERVPRVAVGPLLLHGPPAGVGAVHVDRHVAVLGDVPEYVTGGGVRRAVGGG